MSLCNLILTYFLVSIAYGHPLMETILQENGVTLDLIHRDSPLSPLHDPSITQHERIVNSIRRSISRTFSTNVFDLGTTLLSGNYEYIMKICVGTPPVETILVADMGSDITWFQCNPCRKCNPSTPIFNPKNSRSFKFISCKSPFCTFLGKHGTIPICSGPKQNLCEYHISYQDHSYSTGLLSTETLTFRSRVGPAVQVKEFIFGCGSINEFQDDISGVIGLGGGPLSMVKQLGIDKFSYCLVPIYEISNVHSRIDFGSSRAVVEGPDVVSIPLVYKAPKTFYYVTLKSINVGNTSLTFADQEVVKPFAPYLGNMIIDSGTTVTFLPRGLYQNLEAHLRSTIKGITMPDPEGFFSLCYRMPSTGKSIVFPMITLVFIGGNVELPSSSTFYEGPTGVVCLTMAPTDGEGVLGNLAQANLLVGYDLVNNKVSFKRTDCTK